MKVENIVASDKRTDGVVAASLNDAYFGPSVWVSCRGRQSIVHTLKQVLVVEEAAAAAVDLVSGKLVAVAAAAFDN